MRMGGAWAALAQSEADFRARSLEQSVARQSAEAKLAAEQARTRTLTAALEQLGALAEVAANEAQRLGCAEACAAVELRGAWSSFELLAAELTAADLNLGKQHEQIVATTAEQATTEQVLEEARAEIVAQQAALDAGAAQLAKAQQGRAVLQRELIEERGRSKRALLRGEEKARCSADSQMDVWIELVSWADRWIGYRQVGVLSSIQPLWSRSGNSAC